MMKAFASTTDLVNRTLAPLPSLLTAALLVSGAFAAFLVWDQWHWWGTKPDYMFGYLVPLFVAYVAHDRWPRIRGLASEPPSVAASPWLRIVALSAAACALLVGLGIFALGAIMRAGAGPSQPASLAMALGFSATCLATIYLAAGATTTGAVDATTPAGGRSAIAAIFREPRFRIACLFLFPALVWMISAPLVSALEGALSRFLLQKVTVVVFFTFDALGLMLERHGNVLVLPEGKGTVGVAEACSGIRSLTGSIFSGAFLGAVFLHQAWKKIALLGAALLAAFLTNIVRSLFLTGWAYTHGSSAIEGAVHDITGFAVLGVTFVVLLGLVRVLNIRLVTWDDESELTPSVGVLREQVPSAK